jgi:hypothetical protein
MGENRGFGEKQMIFQLDRASRPYAKLAIPVAKLLEKNVGA